MLWLPLSNSPPIQTENGTLTWKRRPFFVPTRCARFGARGLAASPGLRVVGGGDPLQRLRMEQLRLGRGDRHQAPSLKAMAPTARLTAFSQTQPGPASRLPPQRGPWRHPNVARGEPKGQEAHAVARGHRTKTLFRSALPACPLSTMPRVMPKLEPTMQTSAEFQIALRERPVKCRPGELLLWPCFTLCWTKLPWVYIQPLPVRAFSARGVELLWIPLHC